MFFRFTSFAVGALLLSLSISGCVKSSSKAEHPGDYELDSEFILELDLEIEALESDAADLDGELEESEGELEELDAEVETEPEADTPDFDGEIEESGDTAETETETETETSEVQ